MSIDFEIKESEKINGVQIIKPTISSDSRGNIWTSFVKDEVDALLPDGLFFKHDKFSESLHNVLRGIHGDNKTWKLVTCVYGKIFFAIDVFPEPDTPVIQIKYPSPFFFLFFI